MKKLMPSIRKMLNPLVQEVKVRTILIMIGAVLACSAPFVHMLVPYKSAEMVFLEKKLERKEISTSYFDSQYSIAKENNKFVGFSSPQSFWFAIGMPITIFYFSLFFLYISNHIAAKDLRFAARWGGTIALFISLFFLAYTLWASKDLDIYWYYTALVVFSISGTITSYFLINHRFNLTLKIRDLIRFITIEVSKKYVRKEDQQKYLEESFKFYRDHTNK